MSELEAPKNPAKPTSNVVTELKSHGIILGSFVAFLWLVHLVNAVVFHGSLTEMGVAPRSVSGLEGILFAPFLHGSFAHLLSNTLPLLVLGWFVMLRRKRDLLYVSALSAVVGGLGTWLIAPSNSVHVGASGMIFGYLGYLLTRGFMERRFWPVVGSLAVFALFGGALLGIFPGEVGISWQGHLFGLIGGIGAARVLTRPRVAVADKPKRTRVAPLAEGPAAREKSLARADDEDVELELEALRKRAER